MFKTWSKPSQLEPAWTIALKLVWVDTQNLCRTSPAYSVILDLWLMPSDKALVLEEYLLWCSGPIVHSNRGVALVFVCGIARRGF